MRFRRACVSLLSVAPSPVLAVVGCLLFVACDSEPDSGDQPDPRVQWTYQAPAEIYYGSPALSPDESTVYIGTSNSFFGSQEAGHAMLAVSAADGALRWTYALAKAHVRSSPAVGADGSVTFVAEEPTAGGGLARSTVVRLSSSGTLRWTYDLGLAPTRVDVGLAAPALTPDGGTVVAADVLYALDPDGQLRWKALDPTGEDLRASPVIGADGTVYFASHNIPLTAFEPDSGRVLWQLPLGVSDHVFASPAIGADGTLYVADNGGFLYAVSPNGALQWMFSAAQAGHPGDLRSSPAVAADGTIYFGSTDGVPAPALFALHPDGSVRWIFEPSDLPSNVPSSHFDIYSSPAIGSDGAVYVGHEFGRVYALEGATGAVRWMVETVTGITWSSPALATSGTLFISDLDGRLYAVETESHGLQAGAPWPRYRQNNAGTGALRE